MKTKGMDIGLNVGDSTQVMFILKEKERLIDEMGGEPTIHG
jgi:hypothetical protein